MAEYVVQCARCGMVYCAILAEQCPQCLGDQRQPFDLAGHRGRVNSFSRVHRKDGPGPILAYVDYPFGLRLLGKVTDAAGLAVGAQVRAALVPAPGDGTGERVEVHFSVERG